MSRKGSFRPAWREDVPKPGTYRTIFKYGLDQFEHPSAAWVEMFKAEFGMSDDDFSRPEAGRGRDRLPRPPAPPGPSASGSAGLDRRSRQRRRRRLQPGQVRQRQVRGRGPRPSTRGRRGSARPRGPPPAQGRRRRDRSLLQRPQDPGGSVRGRIGLRAGHPGRSRRDQPGHEDAHEQSPGRQRGEPDGGGSAGDPGPRLRGGPQPRPGAVRHRARLHVRPLPAVIRTRLGRRLDQRPRLGPGVDLLRRRVRHRPEPGIRDPGRRGEDARLSGHGHRPQGQRHLQGNRGGLRGPRGSDPPDLPLRSLGTAGTSRSSSPTGPRRWTLRARSSRASSACRPS